MILLCMHTIHIKVGMCFKSKGCKFEKGLVGTPWGCNELMFDHAQLSGVAHKSGYCPSITHWPGCPTHVCWPSPHLPNLVFYQEYPTKHAAATSGHCLQLNPTWGSPWVGLPPPICPCAMCLIWLCMVWHHGGASAPMPPMSG